MRQANESLRVPFMMLFLMNIIIQFVIALQLSQAFGLNKTDSYVYSTVYIFLVILFVLLGTAYSESKLEVLKHVLRNREHVIPYVKSIRRDDVSKIRLSQDHSEIHLFTYDTDSLKRVSIDIHNRDADPEDWLGDYTYMYPDCSLCNHSDSPNKSRISTDMAIGEKDFVRICTKCSKDVVSDFKTLVEEEADPEKLVLNNL